MEGPLWTERHQPDIADLPQEGVRENLRRAVQEPMNLVVHGPKGAGKTAAVRALARETHENQNDLIELNIADFFNRTKREIREDPRFEKERRNFQNSIAPDQRRIDTNASGPSETW